MQQGLRPFLQQDENSVSYLHRGGVSSKAFGGDGGFGKAAQPVLPGQRKALGNITNRGGLDSENAQPSKTPAAAGPRRALGDITNNAKPQQQRAAAVDKPTGLMARPALTAKRASRLEALAEGGVERLAGKGWQQLEAERREREDAEIDQRLLAFAALGKRSLPTFFPLWVSGQGQCAVAGRTVQIPCRGRWVQNWQGGTQLLCFALVFNLAEWCLCDVFDEKHTAMHLHFAGKLAKA
jgi:hypothetical protein